MLLRELDFSDLYLGDMNCWLSGVPKTFDPIPAPPECSGELAELRDICLTAYKETKKEEF